MELLIRSLIASLLMLNINTGEVPVGRGICSQDYPIFTIGIFADAQYADEDPSINRFYRISKTRLEEAYDTFKKENVDFVINLGDLIDKDYASFNPVLAIIDSSKLKTYHVLGNHDYSVHDSLKRRIPGLLNNPYQSLKSEGFRFIFLNGNEISTYGTSSPFMAERIHVYLDTLRARKKINAMDWNGGISPAQLYYLENELNYAARKHEKVIISCHFPVYPENMHNLLNYEEVLALLKRYNNVIAWFSGHNHAGNYGNIGTVQFITFRGMVETEDQSSYAIARVYDHRIVIKGYGREKDYEFRF
ncbi:MAG TPA: metallophosphoesterase [Bacteroidales bacterium]|nr:metallophosphoesterase [Bacteroidales bacterium]